MAELGEGKYTIVVDAKGAIVELNRLEREFDKTTTRSKRGITDLSSKVTGLAANVTGAYFAFDNLQKGQLRVEQSAQKVAKAQERINTLQKSGKASAKELQLAFEDLRLAQERYKITSGDVQQANIMFGLSMITMATSTIPSTINAIKGMNISLIGLRTTLTTIMTHPVFLIVSGALVAWEFLISKVIKEWNGLDLSITGNIQKLMEANAQVATSTTNFNSQMGAVNSAGGAIADYTTTVDGATTRLTGLATKIAEINTLMISGKSMISEGSFAATPALQQLATARFKEDSKSSVRDIFEMFDKTHTLEESRLLTLQAITEEFGLQYAKLNENEDTEYRLSQAYTDQLHTLDKQFEIKKRTVDLVYAEIRAQERLNQRKSEELEIEKKNNNTTEISLKAKLARQIRELGEIGDIEGKRAMTKILSGIIKTERDIMNQQRNFSSYGFSGLSGRVALSIADRVSSEIQRLVKFSNFGMIKGNISEMIASNPIFQTMGISRSALSHIANLGMGGAVSTIKSSRFGGQADFTAGGRTYSLTRAGIKRGPKGRRRGMAWLKRLDRMVASTGFSAEDLESLTGLDVYRYLGQINSDRTYMGNPQNWAAHASGQSLAVQRRWNDLMTQIAEAKARVSTGRSTLEYDPFFDFFGNLRNTSTQLTGSLDFAKARLARMGLTTADVKSLMATEEDSRELRDRFEFSDRMYYISTGAVI